MINIRNSRACLKASKNLFKQQFINFPVLRVIYISSPVFWGKYMIGFLTCNSNYFKQKEIYWLLQLIKIIGLTYKIKGTSLGMRTKDLMLEHSLSISHHCFSLFLFEYQSQALLLQIAFSTWWERAYFFSVREGFWLVLPRPITLASDVKYLISQVQDTCPYFWPRDCRLR